MKLTKGKIRALLPGEALTFDCEEPGLLDSSYQTAMQEMRSMAELGRKIAVSRSSLTNTVVVRRLS